MSRSAAVLDWGTRVALFVLAAVATLAIVGALVAIPGNVARGLAELEAVREARNVGSVEPREPSGREGPGEDGVPTVAAVTDDGGVMSGASGAVPPPSPDERIAGWLEVIAYTLIANAALLALFGTALLRRRR